MVYIGHMKKSLFLYPVMAALFLVQGKRSHPQNSEKDANDSSMKSWNMDEESRETMFENTNVLETCRTE